VKTCPKSGLLCKNSCCDKLKRSNKSSNNVKLDIKLEDAEFYKVYSVEDLFAVFQQKSKATYILNGGNTANGNFFLQLFVLQKKDSEADVNQRLFIRLNLNIKCFEYVNMELL